MCLKLSSWCGVHGHEENQETVGNKEKQKGSVKVNDQNPTVRDKYSRTINMKYTKTRKCQSQMPKHNIVYHIKKKRMRKSWQCRLII